MYRGLYALAAGVWLVACGSPDRAAVGEEPAAGADVPPIPALAALPDTVPVSIAELEPVVAPVGALIERTEVELRPSSGTRVADSILLAFRNGAFEEVVRRVAASLDQPRIHAAVWPGGSAAQRQRRQRGTLPADLRDPSFVNGTPREQARADSLTAYLAGHGIQTQRGEGTVSFGPSAGVLLERLGPYLTMEIREYLRLVVREQEQPTAADASLMISLDELAARLLSMDEFLEKYPESLVRGAALERYRAYLSVFVSGMDNSRVFDPQTQVIVPERRSSLERFVAEHGDTEPGRTISEFLDLLAANDYTRNDAIDAFRLGLRTGARR
jgi:hypothetical protein